MKKVFLFFILSLIIHSNAFTQNLERLDKINGFRKFKLGAIFSSFTNLEPDPSTFNLKDVKILLLYWKRYN
jgi:Ca2+/Na+ antiporter